jgi:hypothetical protein
MKLKGIPAYVALAGGAIALYAFWKSGSARTAQFDLARATGIDALKPAPGNAMTNPATGQPTFGVGNPWVNDPIFAPYPYPSYASGATPGYTPPSGAMFGVSLR